LNGVLAAAAEAQVAGRGRYGVKVVGRRRPGRLLLADVSRPLEEHVLEVALENEDRKALTAIVLDKGISLDFSYSSPMRFEVGAKVDAGFAKLPGFRLALNEREAAAAVYHGLEHTHGLVARKVLQGQYMKAELRSPWFNADAALDVSGERSLAAQVLHLDTMQGLALVGNLAGERLIAAVANVANVQLEAICRIDRGPVFAKLSVDNGNDWPARRVALQLSESRNEVAVQTTAGDYYSLVGIVGSPLLRVEFLHPTGRLAGSAALEGFWRFKYAHVSLEAGEETIFAVSREESARRDCSTVVARGFQSEVILDLIGSYSSLNRNSTFSLMRAATVLSWSDQNAPRRDIWTGVSRVTDAHDFGTFRETRVELVALARGEDEKISFVSRRKRDVRAEKEKETRLVLAAHVVHPVHNLTLEVINGHLMT